MLLPTNALALSRRKTDRADDGNYGDQATVTIPKVRRSRGNDCLILVCVAEVDSERCPPSEDHGRCRRQENKSRQPVNSINTGLTFQDTERVETGCSVHGQWGIQLVWSW